MIGRATCRHGREQSLIGTKGSSPDQDRTGPNDRRGLSYSLGGVGMRGIRFCCPGSLRSRERRQSAASCETWPQPRSFDLDTIQQILNRTCRRRNESWDIARPSPSSKKPVEPWSNRRSSLTHQIHLLNRKHTRRLQHASDATCPDLLESTMGWLIARMDCGGGQLGVRSRILARQGRSFLRSTWQSVLRTMEQEGDRISRTNERPRTADRSLIVWN